MEMNAKSSYWYHPELDILRFGAFLMVFIFHATGEKFASVCAPGAFGVDLFFTLSAYLITEILLREQRRTGTFNLGAFYMRRALRIWPLYFVFLLLTFLFAQPLLGTEDFPWSARVMFIFFVGNWQFLLGRPVRTIASLLWSVCVEEQFYLTWPLLLRRWGQKLPWIGAGLLLISTAYRLLLYLHGPFARPIDTYWKNTFVHMDPIVIGSLLAFVLKGKAPSLSGTIRLCVGTGGILGILTAGWFGAPYGGRALLTYPLAAVSCGAILISVLRPMTARKPGMFGRSRIHLGRISYGLYVFHAACLVYATKIALAGHLPAEWLLRRTGAFLLTVLAAECSYRFLELPFLRLKRRFSAVESSPVSPDLSVKEAVHVRVKLSAA